MLRVSVADVDADALAAADPADLDELATGDALALESFDVLSAEPAGAVVGAAFAVPTALVRTTGLGPEPADGAGSVTVFLARCVQLAGLVALDDRVVLSAGPTAPGLRSDGVVEALGREPILLPSDSSERLLSLRDLASTARANEQRLQGELLSALEHGRALEVRRDDRFEALTRQLQRLETERNELAATVARLQGERPNDWRRLRLARLWPPTRRRTLG